MCLMSQATPIKLNAALHGPICRIATCDVFFKRNRLGLWHGGLLQLNVSRNMLALVLEDKMGKRVAMTCCQLDVPELYAAMSACARLFREISAESSIHYLRQRR